MFIFKLAFDPVAIVDSNVTLLSSKLTKSKFLIKGLISTSTFLPFLFFLVTIISSLFIKFNTLDLTNSLLKGLSKSILNIYSP